MRTLATTLLLTALGCGTTTHFVPTNPSPTQLTPRPPTSVRIYATEAPTSRYVEVGLLQARQSSNLSGHKLPDIISAMRARAAKVGCDGIILNGPSNKLQASSYHNGKTSRSSTTTLEGYLGTCIVFLAGPAPSQLVRRRTTR